MKNAIHRLLLAGIVWASVSSIQAQVSMVPNAMNYQGLLTDSTGSPVASTTPENVRLEFRLYPGAAGGSALWGEAQTVTVFKGNFSVILGNGNALADVNNSTAAGLANVFANPTTADLYFGVTKDGVEFTPRQKLLSSAYALRAKVAESVNATAQANGVSSQFNWLSANNLTVNGHSKIKGNNVLEFGANEPSITKGPYAGQIGYKSNSDGLDIFGAGAAGDGNDRKITMHAQGGTRFLGPIAFPGLGQFVQLYDANYGMGVQGYTLYSRSSDNFAWYKGGSHNDNTLNNGNGTTLASLNSSGFTLSSGKFTGDGSGLTSINPNSLPNNYNYLAINNRNVIEFGKGENKHTDSGKIGYGTFSQGAALDIVGASTTGADRKINLFAEGGTTMAGGLTLAAGSFGVGQRLGQHLNLWGNSFGIGIQNSVMYFRTDASSGFNWYIGGSHAESGAGGGSKVADLNNDRFDINRRVYINSSSGIPLHVSTSTWRGEGSVARFYRTASGGTGYDTADTSANVSIYASAAVTAQQFLAFSDLRIKLAEGRSDAAKDLETLSTLEVTDYTLKDKTVDGGRKHKKIIAQQLEKVYPQAVSKSKGTVPDIFRMATAKNGFIAFNEAGEGVLKKGETVRLVQNDGDLLAEVTGVEAHGFRVKEAVKDGELFVYGRQVDDFRVVDYEAVTMLNVSATQELYRKLQAQTAALEKVRRERDTLNAEVTELRQSTSQQDRRLAAIEAKLEAVTRRATASAVIPVKFTGK